MKKAIFLFLVLLSVTNSFAQTSRRIDSLMSSLHQQDQFSGSMLVAVNGKSVYRKSLGRENNSRSVYTLGSVSKTLTSTAILQLRERKLLQLDEKVSAYLDSFPYPNITIRHLLTHTSGLPDYNLYEAETKLAPMKIFTNSDIIPSLVKWKKPLPFEPGEKWQYSNTNYSLLALIIQKVTGQSFETYMREKIFLPAGMMHTCFQRFKELNYNDRVTNTDFPFLFSTTRVPADSLKANRWRSYNMSGFVGQGNIMTTTEDLLAFDQALYSGKLLSPQSLKLAFTPAALNNGESANAPNSIAKAAYGLGWFIMQDTTHGQIVWHTGGVPGGLSMLIRNLTKRQTVVAFDNRFGINLYRHAMNAMNILNGQPIVTGKMSLVRFYASALVIKGKDAAARIVETMRKDTLHYFLSEDDINDLGLQLLYEATHREHLADALSVLKQNTIWFPDGFNTYDSYGEALAFTGNKAEAIKMYQKSIELNPNNKGGREALDRLRR